MAAELMVQEIDLITIMTHHSTDSRSNVLETLMIVHLVTILTTEGMVRISIHMIMNRLLLPSTIFRSVEDQAMGEPVPYALRTISIWLHPLTTTIVRLGMSKTTITITTLIIRITNVRMAIRLIDVIMHTRNLSTVMKSTAHQGATGSLVWGRGILIGLDIGLDMDILLRNRATMDLRQPGRCEYSTEPCVFDSLIRVL